MSFLAYFALIATVTVIYLAFRIVIFPKLKIKKLKNKYGDQVIVLYNFGSGLIQEKKKSLKQQGDSLGTIRKLLWSNPKAKAIIHNNASGQIAYSFIDPELIKQVHQQPEFFVKQVNHPAVLYLFSKSILCMQGKEWQKQRQFFGKSFHFEEIRNYLPIIKETSQSVFGSIKENLSDSSQIEIQVVKICESVTSEVVFKAFFGFNSQNLINGSQNSLVQEIVSIMTDSYRIFQFNKLAFIKFLIFRKRSYDFFPLQCEREIVQRLRKVKEECDKIVQQRKQQLLNNPSLYKYNFLDQYLKEILLNKNQDIREENIIDNFLALLFAGTDTTGNMVGTSIFYLSQNPEIQNKARDEVIELLRKNHQCNKMQDLYEQMTFEDITNFNYLNSVLKESLRLIPPAVNVFPRKVIKDLQIGKFQLKKGDAVNTNFICGHYNPQVFKNPEQFDPSRWMNANEQNQFSFTPFSLGPRNCIGQHLAMIEGKCMLAYILLNFEIIPNLKVKVRKEAKMSYGLIPDNLVFFKKNCKNYD
ncbi:cytochrome P450 family monooxygenase (macronuclear) [Tetrahymena thermophila SB210]|uniref:Cytochrome P450 family monooxygenase n=2 Tax=Tetrahymena thermophila TaxID=5911 RepID=Q234T2_TETTS|nr:cytochrome P450 family monooxygenase [Tetrahymena thermophila SB210]ABY59956.1 cytochrome P450 monooxygenase CYP5005A16 [Tetrahymena thermophila]EAR91921.1 cytochrome P450 family monooxygenase [Tetrahymena thermophila SB210]|eukprot:XP_001012166.1 cytochrome P450 family monooxygenase [Tetrahymena thermophila SB210]